MNLPSYIKLTKNGYRIAGNFWSWKFSRLLLNDTSCELYFKDQLAIDYHCICIYQYTIRFSRINFRGSCKSTKTVKFIILEKFPLYSIIAVQLPTTVLQEIRKSCKYFSCKTCKILTLNLAQILQVLHYKWSFLTRCK